MSELDRRTFLGLLGQGAAVLSVGLQQSAPAQTAAATAKPASATGKYQIFYPGQYLDWEKAVVEDHFEKAKKSTQKAAGQSRPTSVVNEYDLLKYNHAWDPYNPLFNDKQYALAAGYPGIPARPCFKGPSGVEGPMALELLGVGDTWYYGIAVSEYEIHSHIFAGDSFTSESDGLIFEDLTVPGSDLRLFRMAGFATMYNAKGEPVVHTTNDDRNAYRKIIDESPKPTFTENMMEWRKDFPEAHYTTDAEWDYIRELWNKEKIRGKEKLYWEDVKIGDEPAWACTGPVSYIDMVAWHGQMSSATLMRTSKENPKNLFRDRYGMYHSNIAIHFGGENIAGARMVFFNNTACNHIVRMVTNYIGDAGLVTRVRWYFKQLFKEVQIPRVGGEYLDKVPYMKGKECTIHPSEGDTVIAKGYVTAKRINDKGEHIIDLSCWAETLDNRLIQIVAISAKLPSRNA